MQNSVPQGQGGMVAVLGSTVEAIEGTAALIQRAGTLCKRRGWTLIKTAADDHDMRADVPSIGVDTIKQCADAGCGCIAVGSGRVILLNTPEVVEAANALKSRGHDVFEINTLPSMKESFLIYARLIGADAMTGIKDACESEA